MAASSPQATIRKSRLGTELRRLRERADLTATEAGALFGVTQSRISNIEAGRYGVSADRVRALAQTYNCSDQRLVDALAAMTGERRRGWWEEYREQLPSRLIDLSELEHHAKAFRVAQVINIPGLLQTVDYARAIFGAGVPPLRPHDVEFRASHRLKRQAALFRTDRPPYTAVVHEAALRMEFGGPAVAKAQLSHLLDLSEEPNITIVVIPFKGQPFSPSGHGVDYLSGSVPELDTVLVDGVQGGVLFDAPAHLEKYRMILDQMEKAALAPAESRDLIHRIANEA